MPEQVRCPSCSAALRVPDNLLGKNVKCPKCQTTFLAEMEEPASPKGIVRKPARRHRDPEEIEEEDFLEEEEEERPRPRRRRGKRSSTAAREAVTGPATWLLVVGILDIVIAIMNIFFPLVYGSSLGTILVAEMRGARHPAPNDPSKMDEMIVGVIVGFLGFIMGPLIIVGALNMKKLSNYGLARTACILAMIPCGNCCILGLPIGIRALAVLNKPDVKGAFR